MPTTDLANVIARWRSVMPGMVSDRSRAELTLILDAAEAGMRARDEVEALKHDIARHVAAVAAERDEALEEAARVAEAIDPEKPANWLHARHKIAFEIRALRARAQEIQDER